MSSIQFTLIIPEMVYSGLVENPDKDSKRLSDFIRENKSTENNYMDLFANTVRKYGKRQAIDYASLLGVNYRHLDGAIRCMSGMTIHAWINDYLRLVACDLIEHTHFNFKEIGKVLGFSQSSFSQFFRTYQKMQPWEYRSLKRRGRKQSFFFP